MVRKVWTLAAAVALLAAPAFAGAGRPSADEIAAEKAALFKQADTDGDGALSPAEFETFRQLVRAQMAERMFARADANGDGKVTLDEIQAARPFHGGCHHGKEQSAPQE